MALTPEQKVTLKAAIVADPAANALYVNGDLQGLADYYNALFSPAFIVWKSDVTKAFVQSSPAFNWTRVDNLSVGKARIWDQMFYSGSINPSQPNIRVGIDATWVGTQADLDVRAAVYVMCKRSATRAEKLFSTGTGTDATPANMTFEGKITTNDLIGI